MSHKYEDEHSPMMDQFFRLKEQAGEAIVFFRCGDFYETFMDDAITAARVCDITLTKRGISKGAPIPLAGVPHHAVNNYIYKLTRAGYRVAICEQMERPGKGKKVLKRELVRTITPGTIIDSDVVDGTENNYLAAVFEGSIEGWGLAYVDITTGEFHATAESGNGGWAAILSELSKLAPSELLVDRRAADDPNFLKPLRQHCAAFVTARHFQEYNPDLVKERQIQIDTAACHRLPSADRRMCLSAAGAIISYLGETQKQTLSHLSSLGLYQRKRFVQVDRSTERNLELLASQGEGGRRFTLLGVLDETVTSMGARRLKQWLLRPLLDVSAIQARLDFVESLVLQPNERADLREALRSMSDIERIVGRSLFGNANARDLAALRTSLEQIPPINEALESEQLGSAARGILESENILAESDPDAPPSPAGAPLEGGLLDEVMELRELLTVAVADEPPVTVREGGMIRGGYDEELDELRSIRKDGRGFIAALEDSERKKTGITSLKVAYNKIFGYYIEVTRANLDKVPESYIRKQTLTNAERFITPELKEYEAKVLHAEDRINDLEYQIHLRLLEAVAGYSARLKSVSRQIAAFDVLQGFAECASRNDYVRPLVDEEDRILIHEGRHPVLERSDAVDLFVPNDIELDEASRILIITGPNMAGKSTYIRQVALLVLMAQIGSYVPAREARIGAVDRIFSRVGASDDLSRGRSTFMVEMTEAANILRESTPRSLVILDEIGRGTSTFDGVSLAWAMVEYLHQVKRKGVKSLFATHYHELAELENRLERVRNYHVCVAEEGDTIRFLYRIEPGFSDHSYGIHVADLAGVPKKVTSRAREVLVDLEKSMARGSAQPAGVQMSLFSLMEEPLRQKIAAIDLDSMSPRDAWDALADLIKEARG